MSELSGVQQLGEDQGTFVGRIRQTLGRRDDGQTPEPPCVDEALVRLAWSSDDLAALFTQRATAAGMTVHRAVATEVAAKRLQLLHELVPDAKSIGYLVNPTNPIDTEIETKALQAAAITIHVRLLVVTASDSSGIEAAFTVLTRESVGGLVLGSDAFFGVHYDQTVALAARYALPVIYSSRGGPEAGGLMSYGVGNLYQLAGTYAGRILKGAKPIDLPIEQNTTYELVINLKTAKALGLTVPPALLARADEVIE